MNNAKALFLKYRELITFAVVGGINTGVDFGVFSLMRFIAPGANEIYAQAAGYTTGLVSGYFLNKYATFKNTAKGFRQALLFLLCNGVTLGISMAAIYLFHSVMGLQEHLAKLFLVTPVTMVINFLSYKYIVFRK